MTAWVTVVGLVPTLLFAAVTTLVLTFGSFLLALVIGLVGAVLQTFRSRMLRSLVAVYVDVFRAVPVLTQLFIIYFGLTDVGIRLEPIPAAIIGFGMNGGAQLIEVFRAGIGSVNQGQMEAAQMLGMTRFRALRIIVLPQAMRVVLPPLGNFVIGLLKDTALASAVAAPELMFRARSLVEKTYLASQIYLTVAGIYLVMSLPFSRLTHWAEMRLLGSRA